MFKKPNNFILTPEVECADFLKPYKDDPAHVLEYVKGKDYQCSYDGTGFDFGGEDAQLTAKEDYHGDSAIRSVFSSRVKYLYSIIKESTLAQEKAACDLRDTLLEQGKPEEAKSAYEDTTPSISPTFRSLRVRGVLYGGLYKHPDVACIKDMQQVGEGKPYYSQNISIATYALEIDDEVLPWLQAKLLCFSSDLPTVPCLFNGPFKECMKWVEEYKRCLTLIPNGTPWLHSDGKPILTNGEPEALPAISGNYRAGSIILFQEPVYHNGKLLLFRS
jgi:hypothetical protein